MSEGTTVIGIAFGNSSSSIGFERDGKLDVIANQDGDRAIPSVISYVGEDEYHGLQAKNQLVRHPKNTITNFRDFIGKSYDQVDPTYCHSSAHPVDLDGTTSFVIENTIPSGDGEDQVVKKTLSVKDVVTRHLDRLRESAQDFIGKPIDGAVIAVPTDFSESQRQELVAAAKDANLNIIQVINEPTAALLAHISQNASKDKLVVVIDIGGTRTDGAIITSHGGIFTILSTLHDYELGGQKLDDALVDYVAKEFEKQYKVDAKSEPRSLAKLRAESESAKKTLSNTTSSNFAVESLAGGFDFHSTINRLRFELIGRPVFARFGSFVQDLITKAGVDVLDVDEVLLVGGTSNIPKVVSTISSLFDNEITKIIAPSNESAKALNPSELIARGTAIQASLIAGFDQDEIEESLEAIVTVAPHVAKPIGIKIIGSDSHDQFVCIVETNTALPIRKTRVFTSISEDVLISVFEGDSEIIVKTVEPPAKEEKENDEDDGSDWSDDEPEEIRQKIIKPGKKLAEAGLKGVTKGSKVEVVINITKDLRLQIAARELKASGVAVRGEIKCN